MTTKRGLRPLGSHSALPTTRPAPRPRTLRAVPELPEPPRGIAGRQTTPPGLSERLLDPPLQALIAGKPEHVVHALGPAPRHDLLAREARVPPQDDPGFRPSGANLRHDPGQLRNRAVARVPIRRPKSSQQQVLAAEQVQRQVAVRAVVAVEEPALLGAVQRIVRCVDVQHDLGRRPIVRLQEQVHQQPIQRLVIRRDPLVAIAPRPLRPRQLQPIQTARRSQRIALVATPATIPARDVRLAHQKRHQARAAKLIVVVQVLVAQRHSVDPLGHQVLNRVLHPGRIAEVTKTGRQPAHQAQTSLRLPKQQSAPLRRQIAAVEAGHHPTPTVEAELKLRRSTLCLHGSLSCGSPKCSETLGLSAGRGPISNPVVKYPG